MFIEAVAQLDFSRKGGAFAKETSGRDLSVVIDSNKHSHTLLELTETCEKSNTSGRQFFTVSQHLRLTKWVIKCDGSSPSIGKYRLTACEL